VPIHGSGLAWRLAGDVAFEALSIHHHGSVGADWGVGTASGPEPSLADVPELPPCTRACQKWPSDIAAVESHDPQIAAIGR